MGFRVVGFVWGLRLRGFGVTSAVHRALYTASKERQQQEPLVSDPIVRKQCTKAVLQQRVDVGSIGPSRDDVGG